MNHTLNRPRPGSLEELGVGEPETHQQPTHQQPTHWQPYWLTRDEHHERDHPDRPEHPHDELP